VKKIHSLNIPQMSATVGLSIHALLIKLILTISCRNVSVEHFLYRLLNIYMQNHCREIRLREIALMILHVDVKMNNEKV